MDPGFPIWGVPTCWGAPTSDMYTFWQKHVKMKEIDPVGGCMLAVPPGSTNGKHQNIFFIIQSELYNKQQRNSINFSGKTA